MAVKKYAGISYDTKTGKFKFSPMSNMAIQRQANAEINPAYTAQNTALQNQLQQNRLDLVNQQQGVMNAYQTNVNAVNDAAKQSANNVSQNFLDRGSARSSFAVNAQNQVGADKVKALANLAAQKNADVGTINNARASAQMDFNNAALQLNAQRMSDLLGRRTELKQGQEDKWLALQQWNAQMKKK